MPDMVNHPPHYTDGKYEVIDFIESSGIWRNFYIANAIKYICRAGKKDPTKKKEDLDKAAWYLKRYLTFMHSDEALDDISIDEFIADKKLDNDARGKIIRCIMSGHVETAVHFLNQEVKQNDNDRMGKTGSRTSVQERKPQPVQQKRV